MMAKIGRPKSDNIADKRVTIRFKDEDGEENGRQDVKRQS